MIKTKEERFHEIAEARVNRVINDIRLLANCANKNNYAYTQEEVNQLFKAIEDSVRDLKSAFSVQNSENKVFAFKK